jgi:hypothetical protein
LDAAHAYNVNVSTANTASVALQKVCFELI